MVRHDGIEHHRDRRRDDRADGRGGGGDRGGVAFRVFPVARHQVDDDLAHADRIRDGGPGHAGEDQRRDHVDVPQPAPEPAHQRLREPEQTVGQRPDVHDVGSEDKERDRQQRVVVEQALKQGFGRDRRIEALEDQVDEAARDHGKSDRRPHERQRHDQDQREREGINHSRASPRSFRCRRSARCRECPPTRS